MHSQIESQSRVSCVKRVLWVGYSYTPTPIKKSYSSYKLADFTHTRCRCKQMLDIYYRRADKKNMLASWEETLAPFDRSWLPLSEDTDVRPKKKEPLSQEMHLEILHFSSGLEMSGAVETLLFTYLWNTYHQQDCWDQVDSNRCNFHRLMPAFTRVSLLERYLVLETAMPRGDIRKRPSARI
jgi:hypothetical protein